MLIEWGFPTVFGILKGAVKLIQRPVKYMMSSESFADDLREEVRKLENEAGRVGDLAQVARNNCRNFNDVFTDWQQNANKALDDAQKLLPTRPRPWSTTCCYVTLPDPYCRYRFSTKAEAEIQVIRGLVDKCTRFRELDNICFINTASGNVTAPTRARRDGKDAVQSTTPTASVCSASTSIKLRNDDVFESRALMIRVIMDALANNSNSVVGVYGMGGIGKSTLLEDVERKIREEKSFDWVAKADVSENPDIKKIQGEIAHALGLIVIKNEEIVSVRAGLLRKRLENEERMKKKVLIILDNLWKGLDLNKVGIPCGHDNRVIGCKLLLTSRDRNVLRSAMGCDKDFLLGELEEEEARSLFERWVGDKVHDDKFKPLVDEALHKCFGMPFLIVHMAKVFKLADLPEWKNVLKQIKLSKNEVIEEVINERLQLSYENLKAAEKSLLALCVACGTSKPSFENLVRYGVGCGLFREDDNMEEARDRLRWQIRTLQASSLLLDSEDVDGFKIHDLVRELVVSVTSNDHPLLILKDKDKSITELPKYKLKSCRAVCFPYVDMKELPQELDCPELQIFLLFTNNKSLKVPDSLFHSMRKLMVLNLTGVQLTPSTPFQFLENLHTLCLNNCSLDNVAILGELKGLQILSFVNSSIDRLPKEIGQLVELRLLDLNRCPQLEIIEPGVLRSLIKLEELYMNNSFDQWNTMDQTPPTNASLIELNHMKNLHTLHVSIPNPSVLPEDLNVEKLTKYRVQIGNVRHWWHKCKGSRTLELELDPLGNVLWKGCIQSILGKTDDLFLDKLDRNEQSVCMLSQKGFPELKHLQVKNNSSIHYILQLPSHKHFMMLESLLLENLINLEIICNGHISSKSFSTLKVIQVKRCDKMEVLFPLSVVRGLPQLEEIKVVGCKRMRGIVDADDGSKVELHKLRVLELCDLPDIKSFLAVGTAPLSSILHDQVGTQSAFFNEQQVAFSKLETLEVKHLDNVEFLFSPSMIKSLAQLRDLRVSFCKKMEAIIMEEEGLGLEISKTLAFPMLTSLNLNYLESLKCFSRKKCSREARSQDRIKSYYTTLFSQEVAFSKLETLEVKHLDNVEFLFSPSMIKSLAQLRDLQVSLCKNMEAIIMEEEGLGLEISETLAFPMLTSLNLNYLESLKCFSRKKCSREAQSQDRIKSYYTTLFSQEVAFSKLETLEVKHLDNVEFLFSPSMIKSLAQLRDLRVSLCKKMEAIIMEEEGLGLEISKTLAFPMLTSLNLNYLESLKCFSRKKCSREARSQDHIKSYCTTLFSQEVAFSKLETLNVIGLDNVEFLFSPSMIKSLARLRDLRVSYCKKMEAIIREEEGLGLEISETLAFPMLTSLNLKYLECLMCFSRKKCSQETRSQDSIKSYCTTLFSQEVAFPKLKALDINSLDNIEMIWDNKIAADSFPKLETLCVVDCNKLVSVVRSFILRQLLSLESLDARSCGSLEVVFELQTPNHLDEHPIPLPLKELTVSSLPKLKCIWDKELYCQFKFQCLRSISVSSCESLTSLFPTSVGRDLIQLEELEINECGIVEIIKNEEGLVPRFVFPRLTSLELKYLGELKCLYTGSHTSCWPALKTLKVHCCDKVKILASHSKNEMPLDKLPLFLIEKDAFPNLQELELDLLEQMEIWHGHFHDGELFCKLSLLKLCHLSQESLISTCRFVESLTNLEEPVVCESYLEDPSSNEEAIEGTSHEMKAILPFSRYIRHLQTLDVSHCDGLSKMFTPTIAKNLVALTKLKISNCKILTEVINDEKGGEGHVVAFNQLKYMELDGLTRLRSFSSGGYSLMFPLLEDIIVTRCPNMKFFSQGPIETSKLKRVQVTNEMWFWAGNLNITIQNMFEEMGTLVGVKKMLLSEFPWLIGKWHNELNPIKLYRQLESMVVDKCPPFVNAIPSKLMLVLDNLSFLQVRDCELLEEIFGLEDLEVVESTQVLPQLCELNLANLPKLKRLWNKDLQESLHFDSLGLLILYNCSNLGHAFTPLMARSFANLEYMEIKECGQMEGVIVEEEGQESAVKKITFLKLQYMKLECLPNLTCFLSGKNRMLECPKLKRLSIAHCPKMRSLIRQSWMENDHGTSSLFTSQVQCPKLEQMLLSHMDNLSKIWSDSPEETLTFDNLRKVQVQNCRSLENVFPHWVATSLTQIKKLQVESCGIEEIVTSGNETPHSNNTQDLFPELNSLVLHDMPQLKNFCTNLPTLNWSFLKELRVTHCDKENMLSFVASMSNWAQKDDQQGLSDQDAHSLFERDFPNLERLLLVDKDIQMIQDRNFPEDIFGKSKALTLACFHDKKAIFPLTFFLERFQNLQSLEVFCSSFEDIFLDEGLVDNGKHPMLESLEELKLNKLHNLKSVWREGSSVLKIFQSIKIFEVWDCPCLTTIFPTVTSFKNLTTLVVKNSSGLVHLVTASMVTNLVHLYYITIIGCEIMKEIVANDGNGKGKVISFGNLYRLKLQNLPNLECFSSIPSCIFRFPSLCTIEVEECPKMKTFSKDTLSTPRLQLGTLFRYMWYDMNWGNENDLNTTIQKLSA